MAEITRAPMALTLIVRVGVDLAKNVIQVHGVDAAGRAWCRGRSSEINSWPGARSCPRAVWWRWRPAWERTAGGVSCALLAWMRG